MRPDYSPYVDLAQSGDTDATMQIIQMSSPLRAKIIRAIAGDSLIRRVGWEELDQVAIIGVLEAIKRYDANHPKAKPFSIVLNYRIRQEVVQWVADNSGTFRMPDVAFRKGAQIDRSISDPWNYSDEELEELSGVKNAGVIVRARLQPLSIHSPEVEEMGMEDKIGLTEDVVELFVYEYGMLSAEDRPKALRQFRDTFELHHIPLEVMEEALDANRD